MDPLSVTASIIAVIQLTGSFISTVYNYRKGVKNAIEDAVKIIQDLTSLSHILEKLLQTVEKEQYNKTSRLASLEGLVKPDGPLESCQKTLESLNAKLQPENGWRAVKQSLIWPLKQDYIKQTLDEIATVKETLSLALSVDHISLALETKDSIYALKFSFESFRFDEKRKAVLSGLSPTDATTKHLEACRKHQKGTGDWFIESEQYLKWVDTADSVLWISGIPGCGKTILCSTAIEDQLRTYQPNRPRTAVAYYYFNFQIKAEQQFTSLLRSIILHLAWQCPNLPPSVQRIHHKVVRGSDLLSEYLIDIVKEVLKSFREVYIVVDAFDECEQSGQVVRWIQELVPNGDCRLHILISSRQDHRSHSLLDLSKVSIFALGEHSFERDIRLYIREQLGTDPRMTRWPSSVKNDIEQSLLAKARGLFRLVDCHLNVLRKCLRVGKIKAVLDTLPNTLSEMYDQIIANIDETYVEDACIILKWLVFSARPLRTIELNEVLAFDRSDPHNPIFSPHLRLPLLEDVLTLCSSLVIVSGKETKGQDDSNIESLEVRLAHSSVKDYLLSHHPKSGPAAQFASEAQMAHSVMTTDCLNYLLQFDSQYDTAMLREFPLAPYAAQFWTEHYRHSEASCRDLVDRLALQLFTREAAFQNCCCLYNPDGPWRDAAIARGVEFPPLPALYYASLKGLSRMVISLLADGAYPNENAHGLYGEALGAAAYSGDEDSVQLLLSAGACPDGGTSSEYSEYGPPIASAASQGHTTIVEVLLKAGACVNKTCFDHQGSALFQAIYYRRLGTAKILLDAGADADVFAGVSGAVHAISIAARRGDRDSVCLLFPRVSEKYAVTVLDEIARVGHRELLETLLQTQRGRDMASYSSEMRQIPYENRLRKTNSADVLSKAKALTSVVSRQITVCQRDLVEAAENGYLSAVQVFLSAGVSSNSHWKGKSCLWAAVEQEHVDTARLLLVSGADPNTEYRELSALNTSIERGNEKLFDLLLENGASTAMSLIEDIQYDTLALPVHYAARTGNIYILRRLLEAGLEVDKSLIDDCWTALFHAAKAGHEEVLRLLVNEYGADVNRRANNRVVAIHVAAFHNHSKCVEAFLDSGLDVNVRGRNGRRSLHWAGQEGSIDVVRILLERGANIFIEEDQFMTAADIAKAKALEIAESQKSEHHWKEPREDNYEPILEMLVQRATQLQQSLSEHSSTALHVVEHIQ